MKNNIEVSISIVAYNSAGEIKGVLDSLYDSNLGGINLKVYVVDNNSADNTVEIVEEKYPEVELIKNEKNVGFGVAHNLAIKKIDSKYHIVVNPDIKFLRNTIQDLVSYMEKNPDVVLATPKILNDDEERTEQFLPKRYPKVKYVMSGFLEDKFKHYKKLRDEYTMRNVEVDRPCEIDFCTGCLMFCRTDALKKVGGFDERYFLHFEDADLTREMQSLGKTMFVPYIQVIHKWKRDNHGNKKIVFIAFKSMMIYYRKWNFGGAKE